MLIKVPGLGRRYQPVNGIHRLGYSRVVGVSAVTTALGVASSGRILDLVVRRWCLLGVLVHGQA